MEERNKESSSHIFRGRLLVDGPKIGLRVLDVARGPQSLTSLDAVGSCSGPKIRRVILGDLRLRDSIMTVSTVRRRAFVHELIAPRRVRKVIPEFRRLSDMFFHPGIGSLDASQVATVSSAIT